MANRMGNQWPGAEEMKVSRWKGNFAEGWLQWKTATRSGMGGIRGLASGWVQNLTGAQP